MRMTTPSMTIPARVVACDGVGGPAGPQPGKVPAEEAVQEGQRIGARELDRVLGHVEERDPPAQAPVSLYRILAGGEGEEAPAVHPQHAFRA